MIATARQRAAQNPAYRRALLFSACKGIPLHYGGPWVADGITRRIGGFTVFAAGFIDFPRKLAQARTVEADAGNRKLPGIRSCPCACVHVINMLEEGIMPQIARRIDTHFASSADAPSADRISASAAAADASAHAVVEGEVYEVLKGFGLAHVRTTRGTIVGLNRSTPGIAFEQLHEGQRVRCDVAIRFNRVLSAELIG